MSSGRVVTTLAGNFGRLWKRGHESFSPDSRRILSVQGKGATAYLQGLVTSDLLSPPTPPREEKEESNDGMGIPASSAENEHGSGEPLGVDFSDHLRATCFLDNKGRIITDSLLWKVDESQYYIDVPADMADPLLAHMKQFVLRRTKVKVKDESSKSGMASHVIFGTLNARNTPDGFLAGVDPRHPSLGTRVISLDLPKGKEFTQMMSRQFPNAPGTYNLIRKLAGVAEGSELKGKVAAETNQEFLNAVSFQKGCYLGQELTARVQFTGAVRKRIMPLMMTNVNMQCPRPWLIASQVQKQQYRFEQQQQQQQSSDAEDSETSGQTEGGGGGEIVLSSEDVNELPPLPRLSPSIAGSMIASMSGSPADVPSEQDEDKENNNSAGNDGNKANEELQVQTEALFEELQSYKVGDKIYDTKDGKAIGQIVALPEEGTNVLLAQMRLDRVGLLEPPRKRKGQTKQVGDAAADDDGPTWKHTNKVSIGEASGSSPLRFLPYLPLWWPTIDRNTGKAKEE